MNGRREGAVGPSVTVRPARRGDATGIARVHVETWRDAYAGMVPDRVLLDLAPRALTASWRRAVAGGDETVRVAVAEAAVVAFGSAGRSRTRALNFAGEVFTLYVHPDHQGRGIGRRLLAALFAALAAQGLGSAVIWVLAANPARQFYRTLGGRLVAHKTERLWGADLAQEAFAWDDLGHTLGAGGSLSRTP